MRWGRVVCAVGLLVIGLALRQASREGVPRLDETTDLAGECAGSGSCVGRLVAASSGGCDDFNECTSDDSWRGPHCAGAPRADGTGCASDCGSCWDGECVANPERNGTPCADGFGARTVEDVCQSVSGIAICLGEFTNVARGGEPCDGIGECAELGSHPGTGLDL